MRIDKSKIVIFTASLFLGIVISMNINYLEKNKILLNPEDYSDAYDERNNLYREITSMKEEYISLSNKLDIYKANDENKYAIIKEMENELNNNKMIMGLEPVEGQGIKIVINDATTGYFGDYYDRQSVVHDLDIVGVINDLRNAGAEAIAINGQRVVYDTSSLCGGSYLDLKGIKIVAPFYVSAIGNKKVLKNYLLLNDTYFKQLVSRRITTEIQESDHVKIPPYTGKLRSQYSNVYR